MSIIIPAFNAEKWIGACIESSIAQTWDLTEIIVVDDGSTDETHKIASSYHASNVKVVRRENRGASSARNFGLEIAQGDFIQWLDADDLLAPTKIQTQMEAAIEESNSKILFSCSWGRFISHPEMAAFSQNSLWNDLEPFEWILRKMEQNLWVPPMVFLTNRSLVEEAGKWNEALSLNDDGEYFSRIILKAAKVRFISEARCFKRFTKGLSHDGNLSDNKLNSLWFTLLSEINAVRNIRDDQRTRKACLDLLNRWYIYFYPERNEIIRQMNDLALDLGGVINKPNLGNKYQWIQKIFGWKAAKKMQYTLPGFRLFANKIIEKRGFKRL